ncbi:MAG: FG-GAP-like repeat-containing protein, partial [Saprospiraceae bacterium]
MNLSIQRTDTRPKANRSLAWGLLLFVLAMPFGALGQIQFTEQAASKGVNLGGTKDGGLAFGDIDNDGDLDLIVNTGDTWGTTANTRVYLNSGPPNYTFTDVTASRCTQCLTDRNTERSVSFGDFNNDGYLDFVVNSSGAEKVFKNRGASQPGFFDRVLYLYADPGDGTGGNGTGLQYGNNTEGAGWFDYDGDGDLDLMFENHNWGIDILENRNFGEGVFQQVTLNGNNPPAPFTRVDGLPNTYSEGDYASITDYDDDGWVDLVCRKDWPGNSNNDFFRNTGPVGGFITFANGQNLSGAPNGNKGAVSMYDFDNDGDFDIAWTDGPNSNNRIYRNNAGTFASTNEPWASAGVTMPSSGLDGLACGDVDNDGDIDIFFGDDSGQSYLFLNQASNGGGMTFVRSNLSINPNANLEGCVFVDFDRDGDLDLYTNVNGGNNQLWVNNLNGLGNYPSNRADAYLMVRVWENRGSTGTVGQHADRPAHGAVLVLKDCNGNVISGKREVNGANGHGTQDPAIVHFGLKDGPNIPYVIEVGYPRYKNAGGTFDRTIVQYSVLPSTLTGYKIVDIYPNSSLPLASAGNGGPYTVGETIQLTASNGVSWSWAGPGGFTSTSQNPTRANATVAMAGTYTVTVTMVGGCTASATTTVAVSAAVPLCSGNTAEVFSIAAVAGATSYSWTLNGNASHAAIVSGQGTTALTVNLSSLAVGSTNTVCVTANNANCTSPPRCQAFTLPTSVSVSVAANPTTICTGGSSTLTATPSGGTTPYTYAWSGGGTASTNTVSPTATTTYTVTVTDAGGC